MKDLLKLNKMFLLAWFYLQSNERTNERTSEYEWNSCEKQFAGTEMFFPFLTQLYGTVAFPGSEKHCTCASVRAFVCAFHVYAVHIKSQATHKCTRDSARQYEERTVVPTVATVWDIDMLPSRRKKNRSTKNDMMCAMQMGKEYQQQQQQMFNVDITKRQVEINRSREKRENGTRNSRRRANEETMSKFHSLL